MYSLLRFFRRLWLFCTILDDFLLAGPIRLSVEKSRNSSQIDCAIRSTSVDLLHFVPEFSVL